jgi:hypothetical protein
MKSRRRIGFPRSVQRRRLNQEFAPGEMGLNGQFAQQQSRAAHVGSGVIHDTFSQGRMPVNVRFAPKRTFKAGLATAYRPD